MAYRNKYYKRKSYRRPYRKSYRRGGQFRAAAQQRDTARCVIKTSSQFTLTIPSGSTNTHGFINLIKELCNSSYYNKFASMFDQIKINGVRCYLGQQLSTGSGNLVLINAIDRNGISITATGPIALNYDVIASYSSAKQRLLVPGGVSTSYISCYPSTVQEKSQYMANSSLINYGNNDYDEYTTGTTGTALQMLPFKPILLSAIQQAGTLETSVTVVFNVLLEYDVTFRGMRSDIGTVK